jgi:hypothetical protein
MRAQQRMCALARAGMCARAGRSIQQSWWIWEILDKYLALVLHYSEGVLLLLLLLRFCVIIIYCALN